MFNIDDLFNDECEVLALKDTLYNVVCYDVDYEKFNEIFNKETLNLIFDTLPSNIKDISLLFGFYDTEVRDEIFKFFIKNKELVEKYITLNNSET
jgi:hypothetical protein